MCKRLTRPRPPLRAGLPDKFSATSTLARGASSAQTSRVDTYAKQDLTKAMADLLYPSESDFPFDLVEGDTPGESPREFVARVSEADLPIEELAPGTFFDPLLESDDDGRFAILRTTLEAHLAQFRVYRVGRTEIDIYLLGKTKDGAVAGLHTRSVET